MCGIGLSTMSIVGPTDIEGHMIGTYLHILLLSALQTKKTKMFILESEGRKRYYILDTARLVRFILANYNPVAYAVRCDVFHIA